MTTWSDADGVHALEEVVQLRSVTIAGCELAMEYGYYLRDGHLQGMFNVFVKGTRAWSGRDVLQFDNQKEADALYNKALAQLSAVALAGKNIVPVFSFLLRWSDDVSPKL